MDRRIEIAGIIGALAFHVYEMSLRKLDGTWRITQLTIARAWAEGDLDLPRIAGERAVGG